MKTEKYTLSRRELATVLAALRLFQATPTIPPQIDELASDCQTFEPLTADEIDELCERLNCGEPDVITPINPRRCRCGGKFETLMAAWAGKPPVGGRPRRCNRCGKSDPTQPKAARVWPKIPRA